MSLLGHLQGLRGIAILAVLFFHFLPEYFPNGYFGVDIFLVLSGYLMTYTLRTTQAFGIYDAADYYQKRAKRILPYHLLVMVVIGASLFVLPVPNLPGVVDSFWKAITLSTNLGKDGDGEDYFYKLAAIVDPFTHTWSLCLEMQFYILFPLLYFVHSRLSPQLQQIGSPFIETACLSLIYHLSGDQNTAFYSVMARMFQCNTGILACILQKNMGTSDSTAHWCISAATFIIISLALFTTAIIPSTFGRLTVTLTGALLTVYGKNNILLKNPILVFIGDISFSIYLGHWPLYCLLRIFHLHSPLHYLGMIILALIVAIVMHFRVERRYLQWSPSKIYSTILGLAVLAALIAVQLQKITPAQIKEARIQAKYYTEMSPVAAIKYNTQLNNLDIPLLAADGCTYANPAPYNWQGYCAFEEPKTPGGTNTLMVIGNSWAANALSIIREECWPYVKNISSYSVQGCDPLPDVINACRIKPEFEEHVQRVRPDILFIVARPIDLRNVDDGLPPIKSSVFLSALRRLKRLEKLVKKRIYILDAFPSINPQITLNVNKFLEYGSPHPDTATFGSGKGDFAAKERTAELIKRCRKCRLFDYVPSFTRKGKLALYHPRSFVTYLNSVEHITLAGLEQLRPLYKGICQSLAKY